MFSLRRLAHHFWADQRLATKILLVCLPLLLVPLTITAMLAGSSLRALGESAITTSSSQGARLTADSDVTLREHGQQELLRVATDQAAISDATFAQLSAEATMLAAFAKAHWDQPIPFDPDQVFSQSSRPADPALATVAVLAPNTDAATAAQDLPRVSQLADLFISLGTADPGFSPTIATANGAMLNYPWFGSYAADYDPRERPWYQAAIGTDRVVWVSYVDGGSKQLSVAAVRRVTDVAGQPVGVVNVSIPDAMVQRLSSAALSEHAYAFVLDQGGHLIFDSSLAAGTVGSIQIDAEVASDNLLESASSTVRDVSARMVAGETGSAPVQFTAGERYIAYAPLQTTGWSIAVVTPTDDVISLSTRIGALIQSLGDTTRGIVGSELSAEEREFALLMALITFVATGAVVAFSRTITRRLERLSQAATALEAGTLSAEEIEALRASDGRDEVALLMRLFARTAARVKDREEQLRQEVQDLHIEIDRVKAAEEVSAITDSVYFQELQAKAKNLRRSPGSKGT